MKTLLSLSAITLALAANTARADIDYENLLDECRDATRQAAALNQMAENLPSDFPNRAGFVSRSAEMLSELQSTVDSLQGVADGGSAEWNAQRINRSLQLIQDLRGNAHWIESEARNIEGDYDGLFIDLAGRMRRLAGDVDDSLRGMESEIR
jgi:hypothetical protein